MQAKSNKNSSSILEANYSNNKENIPANSLTGTYEKAA